MINVWILVDTIVWVKRPFSTVQAAMVAWRLLRERVPAYDQDRWLAPDIAAAACILKDPALLQKSLPNLN